MKNPRRLIYLLSTGIIISLSAFTCDKNYCEETLEVSSSYSVQITPEKKEYKVGDTIWLTCQIPEDEVKQNGSANWLYHGTGRISMFLLKLEESAGYIRFGTRYFDYVYSNGMVIQNGYDGQPLVYDFFYLDYVDGNYSLNVGLIPRFTGPYCFYLNNGIVSYFNDPNCQYTFNLEYLDVQANDHNHEIFQKIGMENPLLVGEEVNTIELDAVGSDRTFSFEVIE